ncbi:hypothetical protein HBB16_07260 [Pseudonocardia sp. MCCB 268]|nr:hypothetical protein [Pseudonocardia cytotoxica]
MGGSHSFGKPGVRGAGPRGAAEMAARRAGEPGVPAPGRTATSPRASQFLDLGSGIPDRATCTNRDRRTQARVYTSTTTPIAVVHSRALLDGDPAHRSARRRPHRPRYGARPPR